MQRSTDYDRGRSCRGGLVPSAGRRGTNWVASSPRPRGKVIAFGHLYGLAAGMMGGANTVLTRYLRIRHSSRLIYAFQCLVGTLCCIPLVTGTVQLPGFSLGMLLLLAAVFGLLGQVTMNHGFRYIRAPEGGTLVMFEAILTSALGILMFQEPFFLRFVLGSVMILGSGIYLGLREGRNVIGIDGDSLSVTG
ncbi:MAG: DMT family transporter [Methanomicrobiales archaeon]|nr:DMT family transporter [Methanomicrobiales archaeon]